MESMTLLNSRSKLSVAKRAAETTSSAAIHNALQGESHSKAAWMLSCSSSGINFAKSNRGIQNERLFSAEQFRCTLRSKLGAGPIEDLPHTEFTCQCTAVYCPREDPFHGCHCNNNHNEIQRVLKDYTKKCRGLPDHAIRLEAFAGVVLCMHSFRPTKPMIRICGIVGRNGCIALHYCVHFLRIFSFVTRGIESKGVGARSVRSPLRLRNAQPARENMGIEIRAISMYATRKDLVAPMRVTADISLIVGPETLWIDVSVVDPGCQHYIQRYRSNEVPDAAAKAMEASKRNHYGTVKDPLPLPPASVITFVLETSGRLGPSALGFIQRISGAHTYLRS